MVIKVRLSESEYTNLSILKLIEVFIEGLKIACELAFAGFLQSLPLEGHFNSFNFVSFLPVYKICNTETTLVALRNLIDILLDPS